MEEKINIIVKEFCNRKHITDVDKISEYQAKMNNYINCLYIVLLFLLNI